MKKTAAVTLLLLFALAVVAVAETVRGPVVAIVELSESESEFSIGLNDIGVLDLAGDQNRFLEGVRLEIRIPGSTSTIAGSVGLYLYSDISPKPERGVMTLRGTRVLFEALPKAKRLFVGVPLRKEHGLQETADSYLVERVVRPADFPIAVALFPIVKGLPARVEDLSFTVRAKPVLRNKGAVSLALIGPEGSAIRGDTVGKRSFRVHIDGQEVDATKREFVLDPGLHELSLKSSVYENERVTFGIEKGSVKQVELRLQRPKSVLEIEAPRGTELFLDGQRVELRDGELSVLPGKHTVLFKLGDYTISKSLEVKAKKHYKISLALNILVNEE